MFTAELDGMNELQAKVDQLANVFSSPEVKDVYMDGAHVLLEEFRDTAPVKTGRFQRSAFIEHGSPNKPDVLFMIDYSICPYAHIVEYGSARHAPHATIRRAVDAVGDQVGQVIADGLSRLLADKL